MENEHVLVKVVLAEIKGRRVERAQQMLKAWLKQEPASATAGALLGLYHLASGQLEDARSTVKQALTVDTNNGIAHFGMANIYLAEQKTREALTSVERANSLLPKDPHIAATLAHLQLQQGKGEEAVALLRGLLKSGQADSTVKLVLSEVLINQNNKAAMDEAVKILIELCQVNPEVSEAWALYATAARAMGDFQTSEKLLQFALILEPDRPDFLMSLTQVLASRAAQDKNLLNKAEECAARTVALIPQDWRPALLHVHILRMGSRLVDAWGVLENAAQSFPTQSEVLVEQATLQSEVGRFNEARMTLQKIRSLPDAKINLDRLEELLLWREGQSIQAMELAERTESQEAQGRSRLSIPIQAGQLSGQVVGLVGDSLGDYLVYLRFVQGFKTLSGAQIRVGVPPMHAAFVGRVPGVDSIATQTGFPADAMEPLRRLAVLSGIKEDKSLFTAPYIVADAATIERVSARRKQNAGPCVVVSLSSQSTDAGVLEQLRVWLEVQTKALVVLLQPIPQWQESGQLDCVLMGKEPDIELAAAWTHIADHIIAGDDFLAHLAGSMGRKAHVLLPITHDPLWGTGQVQTPWYPSLLLYSESLMDSWSKVWPELQANLVSNT